MRKDFNKLLCERSRRFDYDGTRDPDWDQRHLLNQPKSIILSSPEEEYEQEENINEYHSWEDLPSKDKRKGKKLNSKRLNENLSPLVGFLKSRCGKNWDDVYSELCENLRKDKAINLHVFQHLWGYIEKHTRIGPNHTLQYNSYGRWMDIKPENWFMIRFYIHPETNILCKWPAKKKKRMKYDWRWFLYQGNPLKRFYIDKNNNWNIVIFEKIIPEKFGRELTRIRPLEKNYAQPNKETEFIKQTIWEEASIKDIFAKDIENKNKIWRGKLSNLEILNKYWGSNITAIKIIPLSQKEAKEYNLDKIKAKQDWIPRRNPRFK